MRRHLWAMHLGLSLLLITQVHASEMLTITVEQVKVYSQPSPDSNVITTLFRGESLPVAPKEEGGFRKVLLVSGSKKVLGYINSSDLTGNTIKQVPRGTPSPMSMYEPEGPSLHNIFSAGITFGGNYQYQGTRSYNDEENGNAATVGALTGFNYQVGVFLNIPAGYNLKVHSYVHYKSVSVTGTATYSTTTIAATPTDTFLQESFAVLGIMAQWYPTQRSSWWYGLGTQWDHGLSGTLKFGGFNPVALTGSDLPNFFTLYAASGAEFKLSRKLFLVPDFRLGVLANAKPIIIEGDLNMSLVIAF